MNRIACQYAIVRFAPFVETGEFANVGILMMAPQARFFGFKLETRRFGRITQFFKELDRKHYLAALQRLHAELERVHELLKDHGFDRRRKNVDVDLAQRMFTEIIRPRESTVRFSEPRVVLAKDPAQKLQELFGYYVERNFVTKEYRENLLEKSVRQWLFQARVGDRFVPNDIGDATFHMKFPFVEVVDAEPVKIIKPLDLGRKEPRAILEKGALWAYRLKEFKRRGKLPKHVLFAVGAPEGPSKARTNAFRNSTEQLQDAGVQVVRATDREEIIDFARAH